MTSVPSGPTSLKQGFDHGSGPATHPADPAHGGMDQNSHAGLKAQSSEIDRKACLSDRTARPGNGSRFCHASAATPIAWNILRRNPHACGWLARLPEHVDRDAATWIPVGTNSQPFRIKQLDQTLCDGD